VVLERLAAGRRRHAPLQPRVVAPRLRVSVAIPARDEAHRIGPCLAGLAGEPGLHEILVIDDGSTDETAAIARRAGAKVVPGVPPPDGWVGKPWALQQGLEAAGGDIVIFLDADTRPRPGLAGALVEVLEDADLVTVGPRFTCETVGERLLHPSMLASLVYRYGPQDAHSAPRRLLANGQCVAARRGPLLAADGFADAASHMTDDAALARGLAARGWRIAFRDGAALLDVRMHASWREVWREWGRSIALADVTPPVQRAGDAATVWLLMALPVLRGLAGRPRRSDLVLLGLRVALLAALRGAYGRRGVAFWLSPLADPVTAVRLSLSALRPPRAWKGRVYGAGGRARRSGS
jgi:dolichol-phosphate mannosyltransferase